MTDRPVSSSTTRGNVLGRGLACIRCRRRKMVPFSPIDMSRCDGARPTCTPCIEAQQVMDCEYSDGQSRTRTEILEEQYKELQLRLQELEGRSEPSQTLLLRDPYLPTSSAMMRRSDRDESILPHVHDTQPAALKWWEAEELSPPVSDALVAIFLPHSEVLGFAVNPVRFKVQLALPIHHPERPHPALTNAIYLWALRISNLREYMQHEDVYRHRAVLALQGTSEMQSEVSQSLAQQRVQAVQAETLLAQYFFCLGLTIEGRYHANAAVTLAVSCGLHQIMPTGYAHNSSFGSSSASFLSASFALPAARDATEQAERIGVFWSVFNVDACWSVALALPRSLTDEIARGTEIDTSWSYEQASVSFGNTVQRFLSAELIVGQDDSHLVLRAKASALYERAATLSTRFGLDVSLEPEVQRLAHITSQFAQGLIPLDQLGDVADDIRVILAITHGIAHTSMIHLHRARPSATPGSSGASLQHANEILAILEFISSRTNENEGDARNVVPDPILAASTTPVIGSAAGKVFIERLDHLKHEAQTREICSQHNALRPRINRLVNALRTCAGPTNASYPVFFSFGWLTAVAQHADRIGEDLEELADDMN
ncbi:uncharacterized protein FOMMEDRAFT_144935 [Fomitiporia mediterranea MF3/22]|uniref:uncharacterized protein n=1 Tax=Fomitiporia mediterranea (strain MF3/22) TaxID=694068 RepID=UPI0004408152|nr:uncharacterized protein FOMMEDRAFT_144935 [Fomitiporia mediterranea MF3/22]EJD05338.1 hypothetical protein FOMMEDRAFT_144935 [Fomitiporia mediterranea MF3/22]